MFTLQQFNLILGMGWDERWDDRLHLTFHEQEEGFTEEVTVSCDRWRFRFPLDAPYRTAHLPSTMSFKIADLRAVFRKLNNGYKSVDVILPLEFREEGFEVKSGPGRGSIVPTVK